MSFKLTWAMHKCILEITEIILKVCKAKLVIKIIGRLNRAMLFANRNY